LHLTPLLGWKADLDPDQGLQIPILSILGIDITTDCHPLLGGTENSRSSPHGYLAVQHWKETEYISVKAFSLVQHLRHPLQKEYQSTNPKSPLATMAVRSYHNSPSPHTNTRTNSSTLLTIINPAVTHFFHLAAIFQHLLSTTLFVSMVLAANAWYASKILTRQLLFVTAFLSIYCYYALKLAAAKTIMLAKMLWKRTEKARDRMFFEFMVWVLNPNAALLLIFWPGWIVFAALYIVWRFLG